MGISGLLKEIGKGERIALSKLAVEFLERNRRPIRIAIDIAIWQFQSSATQGGQNPGLRTFYYRLLKLLALPINPLFVYDGPKKPLAKRNKIVSHYATNSLQNEMSKKLLRAFRFPYRTAPGEAEAECSFLQREGIVDAVMSQDVDAVMWGSTMTLRDWAQEGLRGNKTPTHVSVIRSEDTRRNAGLDPDGMILVALLSGGDYSPEGVPGFGPGLACEIARAHFGSDLLEVMAKGDRIGLAEWKERLQYELETNESGHFKTKHKSVKLPADFPNESLLGYYTHPAVSSPGDLPQLRIKLGRAWDEDIDVTELRQYAAQTLNWQYRGGACKFVRTLAPALLAHRMLRGQPNTAISSDEAILERRMHYVSDGLPELRVVAVPADIVGLNIDDEEESPDDTVAEEDDEGPSDVVEDTSSTSKPARKAPWDPRVPEKVWLPETIVKLGIPDMVEDWEEKQREKLAKQRQAVTNKARRVNLSTTAVNRTRPIQAYFPLTKRTQSSPEKASSPDPPAIPHGRTNHSANFIPPASNTHTAQPVRETTSLSKQTRVKTHARHPNLHTHPPPSLTSSQPKSTKTVTTKPLQQTTANSRSFPPITTTTSTTESQTLTTFSNHSPRTNPNILLATPRNPDP